MCLVMGGRAGRSWPAIIMEIDRLARRYRGCADAGAQTESIADEETAPPAARKGGGKRQEDEETQASLEARPC